MKLRDFILLLPILLLAACSKDISTTAGYSKDDSDCLLVKKTIVLENHSNEYKLKKEKMDSYFYKDGNVPLIALDTFVSSLDGFISSSDIDYSLDEENLCALQKWSNGDKSYTLTVFWATNKMDVNDTGFFSKTCSIIGTDYGAHSLWKDQSSSNETGVTFDVGKYDFDILYYKGEVLIPFPILNVLFCSTNQANIIYNGEDFNFILSNPGQEELNKIRESSLNGTTCPMDIREASTNGFLFTMDYFYGLKEYKNITSFEEYIGEERMSKMLSKDPYVYNYAYSEILLQSLDELHTSINGLSVYDELHFSKSFFESTNNGMNSVNYDKSFLELRSQYKNSFNDSQVVRYSGKTAFIKFDSFTIAPDEYLYDDEGNTKEDAWKYDTYQLLRKSMDDIMNHDEVENIVIDITVNGGGFAMAMLEALGFMTNDNIQFSTHDSLSKEDTIDYFAIDSDGDGSYEDDDAYSQYNWNVLVSSNSFSAANAFPSICKSMGIAKLLGEKSGGGMCAVMECSLMDGTTFRISSNTTLRSPRLDSETNKTVFDEIESGVTPDYEINRSKFYDLVYLDSFISNDYNN